MLLFPINKRHWLTQKPTKKNSIHVIINTHTHTQKAWFMQTLSPHPQKCKKKKTKTNRPWMQ